jgi:hypothetical protein
MNSTLNRSIAAGLLVLALAACSGASAPPAAAPSTDVNPITGSRGGSGAK